MSKFVPERRYGWRLTGDEILLDLTAEDGKRGIYALNPFETEPKPKLLIPGGMSPVWNHRRTLFAYYRPDTVVPFLARRDGYTFAISYLNPRAARYFQPNLAPVNWTTAGNFFFDYPYYVESDVCRAPLPDTIDLRSWKHYAVGGPGPILRLRRRYDLTDPQKQEQIPWSDIRIWRTQSYSPDDEYIAVEVAPLPPMDLLRKQSKIYIYRNPAKAPQTDERALKKHLKAATHLQGAIEWGRRLTSLPDSITEMQPLWSPDGRWIALTVVHWEGGYMTAAVCKPDGSAYQELLTSGIEERLLRERR